MRLYGRRPLSRLESALYAAIAAILAAVLLDRLYIYFEIAEQAATQVTLVNLQAGLNTRLAYDVMRGEAKDLAKWRARNPFELAGMRPANFLGELDAPDLASQERGNWLFDRSAGQLVYLPKQSRSLSVADPDQALRFRLQVSGGPGAAYRAIMVPVAPYKWEPTQNLF
jgi:general secretion pathway protein G